MVEKEMRANQKVVNWLIPILMIVILLLSLAGCAGWRSTMSVVNSWSRPAECADSLIYDNVPAPKVVEALLTEGVSQLAEKVPDSRKYLIAGLDRMDALLADNKVTYIEIARAVADHVDWINKFYGKEFLSAASTISFFNRSIPIYECDLKLLKTAVTNQRAVIEKARK